MEEEKKEQAAEESNKFDLANDNVIEEKPIEQVESNDKNNETSESQSEEDLDPIHQKLEYIENFEYEAESLKKIEDARSELLKYYKRNNIIKWIVALVGLGIIAFMCIGLPNIAVDSEGKQLSFVMPLMIASTGVCLVGIFTYTALMKKSINKRMKSYFAVYYEETSKYLFDQPGFSEFTRQNPDKIEKIQFDENLLFTGVAEIGSRGLTEFKYKDKLLMMCECSAQVRDSKRIYPVFVGKYIIGPCSYESEDRIVIYLKGDNRAIPPTNTDELEFVYDDEQMSIYSNNPDWEKVFKLKVKKALKDIKTGGQLVDVSISMYNEKVFILLGYDDPVMVLPLEHAFDPNPIKECKSDLAKVMKFIEAISK